MTEEELVQMVEPRPVKRGRGYYFTWPAALEFVRKCEATDFAVLGIEAFRLTPTSTEPDTNLIADFSPSLALRGWPDVKARSNSDAHNFLTNAPKDRFFTFVVWSSAEHARLKQKEQADDQC